MIQHFQSLFIYKKDGKYEWLKEYTEELKSKLYGGFLYYPERKEYKLYKYNREGLELCDKLLEENILRDLLSNIDQIYKGYKYGYLEYNDKYKDFQNSMIMKIKTNRSQWGSVFISSASKEWTSDKGIDYIKDKYKQDWNSIKDKEIETLDIKTLAVLIEVILRKNNNFIQADLLWFHKKI